MIINKLSKKDCMYLMIIRNLLSIIIQNLIKFVELKLIDQLIKLLNRYKSI